MRVALDTNRYTDLCRGDERVAAVIAAAREVWLPFVVVGELRAGFSLGRRGRENEGTLRRFLATDGVATLFATDATTRHYALLFRQLREQGTPIPTNDLWIAALVAENELALLSRDAHFRSLPQLDVID